MLNKEYMNGENASERPSRYENFNLSEEMMLHIKRITVREVAEKIAIPHGSREEIFTSVLNIK